MGGVSILILLEIALEAFSRTRLPPFQLRFQSLFCWKLLWKTTLSTREKSYNACFNPYSAGNCSGSSKSSTRVLYWFGFNPYSAGNCSGSCLALSPNYPQIQFQSLFCWKLLWKKIALRLHRIQFTSFNPYSAGNCSGSVFLFVLLEVPERVSILILLEIALEVTVVGIRLLAALCFNPYSAGNCSGRQWHHKLGWSA